MTLRFLVVCLLSLPSFAFASADFVGIYHCVGFDPYINQNYSGTVTVSQQHTVYQLEMNYDTGEKSIGTGGQYDPMLMSVVFQDTKNPKNTGLEQYKFSDDKNTMHGFWVYLGGDKLGKEVCQRLVKLYKPE